MIDLAWNSKYALDKILKIYYYNEFILLMQQKLNQILGYHNLWVNL